MQISQSALFYHLFERPSQYRSSDTLLRKMGWVVTFGVSKPMLFKYIENMG